jgi:uncharacterized protein GlcG (DUF336 family)
VATTDDSFSVSPCGTSSILLTACEVEQLLDRASAASASNDAIIAIVDRGGRILGVRVEDEVTTTFAGDDQRLVFAIDGAIAKARTAAFFSNDAAPLTSRTIRFISQSTITQREVESNPNLHEPEDATRLGPGFVAPIGVGGHFPPEVSFTPLVDLFAIEHQSRDSRIHPGSDNRKSATDARLDSRFNSKHLADGVELEFPESYGFVSKRFEFAQARGIGTLPGGVPLFRFSADKRQKSLVGGIGVFFPGPNGFATFEQNFVHSDSRRRFGLPPQTEAERMNAPKALESEWIALAATGGIVDSNPAKEIGIGTLGGVERVTRIGVPGGRIDLVGITLEIYGPHPTRQNRVTGVQTLLRAGKRVGQTAAPGGTAQPVNPGPDQRPDTGDDVFYIDGKVVPTAWLIEPHASADGTLTEADVIRIIENGVAAANTVRAAIRLDGTGNPGPRTRMVFAVADKMGDVLGLYRMDDATVFSIDVAVAKARNTAYYADSATLQLADQVDDNDDRNPDIPAGVAFTNRTFRFLVAPRFPTGAEGARPGDFSILRDPGINPLTAENIGEPLLASVYSGNDASVQAFNAFNPSRNFRDPDDVMNQNGVVFFPGSTSLYVREILVGGFGVSGDGVDQDDVVTVAGQAGFEPPVSLRVDQDRYKVRHVRLPYQKFLRNPLG